MTAVRSLPISSGREASGRLKDAVLARKVVRAIAATGYAWLDAIDVSVRDGEVTLNGEVHSLLLREAAREATRTVPHVNTLHCQLRVI